MGNDWEMGAAAGTLVIAGGGEVEAATSPGVEDPDKKRLAASGAEDGVGVVDVEVDELIAAPAPGDAVG